jgi:hypothetical protein
MQEDGVPCAWLAKAFALCIAALAEATALLALTCATEIEEEAELCAAVSAELAAEAFALADARATEALFCALAKALLAEDKEVWREAMLCDAVDETLDREIAKMLDAEAAPALEADAEADATKPLHSGRIALLCGAAKRGLREGAGVIKPGRSQIEMSSAARSFSDQ